MLLRILSCLLCLSFCNISIADDTCVKEGHSIVIYPGAPNKCCAGLTLKAPPKGSAGSGGMCVESTLSNVNNTSRDSKNKDQLPTNSTPKTNKKTDGVEN